MTSASHSPPARPHVVCITQARMGSTRLPGKVLMSAAGRPLLAHQLDRLRYCHLVSAVVLATSTAASDDAVADLGARQGVAVFRGDEADVLGRFAGAAAMAGADVVVRVTGDCPLIDPALVDEAVAAFLARGVDYQAIDTTCYPRGLDAEVMSRAALDHAAREAADPAEREHVTLFIYRRPDRFRLGLPLRPAFPPPPWRLCVDEPADLELVRHLLAALPPGARGWQEVCTVLAAHPDWAGINHGVAQRIVL